MTAIVAIEQFVAAARTAAATVELCPRSRESLATAVRRAVAGARRVLLAEPSHLDAELFCGFAGDAAVVRACSPSEMVTADAGITEAFAAVARTGSVCVSLDEGMGGIYSLVAPLHVCVIDSRDIVARPRDIMHLRAGLQFNPPANFVFITGPSATADMGPLVRGVHGPHRLHLIVME